MLAEYDQETYDAIMDMFDYLPIAACVNGQYLALHGGISDKLTSFESLNTIVRGEEPAYDGLINDILWADPMAKEDQPQTTS